MSKHLEILENFKKLSRNALIALVGQILTTAEDVAYAYDITEEMTERLKEDLDEFEISCKITDEEFWYDSKRFVDNSTERSGRWNL